MAGGLVALVLSAALAAEPLSGVVVDEAGVPVAGAWVWVGDAELQTGPDGAFAVPPLAAGTWELTTSAPGFAPGGLSIDLVDGAPLVVIVTMIREDEEPTDVIEVVGQRRTEGVAAVLEERRLAATPTDAVGAEQIARSGDGNAAAAVRRVTGLTAVDGRYLYVRGLGERYSLTTLNGTPLPSPEPEQRVVPLDLFPAGFLGSVVVDKAPAPNLAGEFGGGVVTLRTRDIPDAFTAKATLTGTLRPGSTLSASLAGDAGPTDFLGVGAGHRALPGSIEDATADQPLEQKDAFSEQGFSAEELEALGESLPNRWALSPVRPPPDLGGSLVVGDTVSLFGRRVGLYGAASLDHAWDRDTYEQTLTTMSGGKVVPTHHYTFDELDRTVRAGLLGAASLQLNADDRLDVTSVALRTTDGEARTYEGYNADLDGDIRVTRTRWIERTVLFEQVAGHHELGDVEVDWRAAAALALRLEPDTREWRQDRDGDRWLLSDRPEGNQLQFGALNEKHGSSGLDVSFPLGSEGHLAVGGAAELRDRAVDLRRFKFQETGPDAADSDVRALDPGAIFAPEHIGKNGWQLSEFTRPTDNYTASRSVLAGYGLVDAPVARHLRVMAGARVEVANAKVTTFALFDPSETPVVAAQRDVDVLPSLATVAGLSERDQLRVAYGRTVNRPEFRELSPASWNEVTGGREVFGNPELERALIDHAEARWERFVSDEEVVSFGVFGKRLTHPIEQIVEVSAQHSITWANAEGAWLGGVEAEVRRHIAGPLEVAVNGALVASRVDLPNEGIQTSHQRALQGQSPYVVNAEVGWRPEGGVQAAVLYHVEGPRIAEVGALGAPDVVFGAVHRLDAYATAPLGKGFGLSLVGRNLLDPASVERQGDQVVERRRDGSSLALRVEWAR